MFSVTREIEICCLYSMGSRREEEGRLLCNVKDEISEILNRPIDEISFTIETVCDCDRKNGINKRIVVKGEIT